jgi:Na+/H+ antiporter NhaD/arsenite permease-like protein
MIRLATILALLPLPAAAAALDGTQLSVIWMVPFIGILLSIAFMPLFTPALWHHHYGKVAAGWSALLLVPLALVFGVGTAWGEVVYVATQEYIPFIMLLLALYTTGGGVLLRGTLVGTPVTNTALLALGTVLASVMGTTGASMLLIRPVLRANAHRRNKTHVFVFFIFLVSNIGGSLTPIGDPPLYLGFLAGVPFFWPTTHLFGEFLLCAVALLAMFFVLDTWAYRRERPEVPAGEKTPLTVVGWVNVWLIGVVVLAVLMQGYWKAGMMDVLGESVPVERVVAIGVFLAVTVASMWLTPRDWREENGFAWGAMAEVAKLFAAIFVCMGPVLAILKAGSAGAAAGLVAMTSDASGAPIPWVYFWMSGILSSFLDNAPTYLVFFNLAGGDAAYLTTQAALTLAAISCGSVFMGANSYIGNAPNFMVKAIVEENGVRMPSFFGYVGWACVFLLPLFVLVTLVFFL